MIESIKRTFAGTFKSNQSISDNVCHWLFLFGMASQFVLATQAYSLTTEEGTAGENHVNILFLVYKKIK